MTVEEYVEARACVEAFEADYDDKMPPLPVGGVHGFLVSHITELLQNKPREVNQYELHYVLVGEVGIRFDKPYGADIAVFQRKQFPQGLPAGFIKNTVPPLIVEVVSTHDTVLEVEKKIMAYTKAGVGEFWLVKSQPKYVGRVLIGSCSSNKLLTLGELLFYCDDSVSRLRRPGSTPLAIYGSARKQRNGQDSRGTGINFRER